MAARYEKLLRQSKEDQLEIFKAYASERKRAMEADECFREFAMLLIRLRVGGVISIDVDRLRDFDQVMKELAMTMPSFMAPRESAGSEPTRNPWKRNRRE